MAVWLGTYLMANSGLAVLASGSHGLSGVVFAWWDT